MTYEPSDKIGALTDAELATFLAEPWNGRLATITPEGWITASRWTVSGYCLTRLISNAA